MTFNFYSDNTLGAVGNYRIITFAEPFDRVQSVSLFSDVVTGGAEGSNVNRYFRYSTDQLSWSLWIELDPNNPTSLTGLVLNPDCPLYLEFKYQAVPEMAPSTALLYDEDCYIDIGGGALLYDESTSESTFCLQNGEQIDPPFVINSITLEFTTVADDSDPYAGYVPPSRCSDEYGIIPIIKQDKFTFDPYSVNKGINLYKELSNMTNQIFGHEIVYYRVSPQLRSADVVLKEWTIHNVSQQKCIKILVPNNEFPDSKPHFNNFGIDFEIPFEVHIDRTYWESMFGMNTMPQEKDIIYFPLLNRIYEVQSTYVYRDFMQQALYFKAQLIKYQPRAATIMPDNIAQQLNDMTISTEELFEEEMEREIKRVTKPEQYVTITHAEDPTRESVNRSVPIDRYELYNNWTLVSESYYNLHSLYSSAGSVDAVIYRANAYMKLNESRSFTFWFNPQAGSAVAQERPLIYGRSSSTTGLSIDLVYSTVAGQSAVKLTMNSNTYVFTMPTVTMSSKWYAMVVNVSNEFAQAGLNLWEPQDGTGEMKMLHSKTINISPAVFDTGAGWRLKASPLHLTNIRVFGRMLEEEKQNIVLNQMVVQDSDEALVIDNAKVLLRLPKFTNPK